MRFTARALLPALCALTVALVVPASAAAAEPVGSGSLVVSKGKWKALGKRGIDFTGAGDASSSGRRTRLQIAGGTIGDGVASISLGGALKLVADPAGVAGAKPSVVRLGALRAELGPDSVLTARLGGRSRVVFDLEGGTLTTDAAKGAAKLQGARLVWRAGAARALRSRLGVALPGGALGSLTLTAATIQPTPQSGPVSDEPPLLPRPASAVDVKSATLTWHVRDSWIRYTSSEETPQAIEGAVPQAPIEEKNHPCPDRPAGANPTMTYSFAFPFANGWYDAPSGRAAIYSTGGVRFSYPSRGIDLTLRNPEIEISGSASRTIFRLRGFGSTPYPDKRAAIFQLLSPSLVEAPTQAYAFPAPVRAKLTADGQSVFAGFYPPPGDSFGCFSLAFATG